ncbi:MAG: HXXEE domain-containing protein [Flavobacteriaceae bacterium]|nr:HXXEE domain-containing protein [Flavobacteriaceae bacterium]
MKSLSPVTKWLALSIVFIQAFHSIEEYLGELWENLPPARFLCSLISDDLEKGFLIINIGLFIFGILGWLLVVRTSHFLAKPFISFWIFIEIANGFMHPIWVIIQDSYRPGVITAPFLLLNAIFLLKFYRKDISS